MHTMTSRWERHGQWRGEGLRGDSGGGGGGINHRNTVCHHRVKSRPGSLSAHLIVHKLDVDCLIRQRPLLDQHNRHGPTLGVLHNQTMKNELVTASCAEHCVVTLNSETRNTTSKKNILTLPHVTKARNTAASRTADRQINEKCPAHRKETERVCVRVCL